MISDRNPYEVHAEIVQRIANLEAAVLVLGTHVGWSRELQVVLDKVRELARDL